MDKELYRDELLKVLVESDKVESQLNAIYLLVQENEKRAVPPLLNVLQDDEYDGEVREAAAKALGKLGDLSTIAKLQWIQENETEGVCWAGRANHEITAAITEIKSRYEN